MSSASIHDSIGRKRKPRVHLRYDVEIGEAKVEKELPFVIGVLGDFSGNPTRPLKPLSGRKFVQIDRDNFDEIMAKMTPGVHLKVANTLASDGSELSVQLKFDGLDDFAPAAIAHQVTPLRKLLEARDKLKHLLTKVDRSDEFERLIEELLKNTDEMKKLATDPRLQIAGTIRGKEGNS